MKVFITLFTMMIGVSAAVSAAEMTATEIIEGIHEAWNQDQAYAVMTMTINTSGGEVRTFKYESWSKDKGDKNLMKYLEPSRVKGQATLMLNNADDIWVYFPRTKRVRKLATHAKKQKMEGSDFSYEDMGSGDTWLEDFNHNRLPDEQYQKIDCYVLAITPKEGVESGYSKMVMWVDQETYITYQVDYYDEKHHDIHLKRLTCENVQDIQGVPTAMKFTMHSYDGNSDTIMEIIEMDYSVKLNDEMFTERGLRK